MAWQLMNEDTMLVVLKYLSVYDYVQLTLACRKFLYFLLGPNNYFWAQLCNNLHEHENQVPQAHVFSKQFAGTRPKSANDLLKYVQKGRKFVVDGKAVDLNKKINTIDKHFVGQFQFKDEIKTYFFDAILRPNLDVHIRKLLANMAYYPSMVKVDVERQPNLKNLWTNLNTISHHYNLDYSFIIDIGMDPAIVERLIGTFLPVVYKNRLVWYVRGDQKPGTPTLLTPNTPYVGNYMPSTAYLSAQNVVRHPDVFQLPIYKPNEDQPRTLPSLSSLGLHIPPNFK
jgi:hypothetical protein